MQYQSFFYWMCSFTIYVSYRLALIKCFLNLVIFLVLGLDIHCQCRVPFAREVSGLESSLWRTSTLACVSWGLMHKAELSTTLHTSPLVLYIHTIRMIVLFVLLSLPFCLDCSACSRPVTYRAGHIMNKSSVSVYMYCTHIIATELVERHLLGGKSYWYYKYRLSSMLLLCCKNRNW